MTMDEKIHLHSEYFMSVIILEFLVTFSQCFHHITVWNIVTLKPKKSEKYAACP